MSAPKLSDEMLAAVELAREHGGKLKRLPGGFWVGANDADVYDRNVVKHWFGTQTIRACVKRGVLNETAFAQTRYGAFCVGVTVVEGK